MVKYISRNVAVAQSERNWEDIMGKCQTADNILRMRCADAP